jgi:hypothetical protein
MRGKKTSELVPFPAVPPPIEVRATVIESPPQPPVPVTATFTTPPPRPPKVVTVAVGNLTTPESSLETRGQPVPMDDAPATFPDASWTIAQLLDYGARKWQNALAKLKASVLDQYDLGHAVRLAHRQWGNKLGWTRELQAHGLAYSTARSRERIAEDCTREYAAQFDCITALQEDLGHIKPRVDVYEPESEQADTWKAGWQQAAPAPAPRPAPAPAKGKGKGKGKPSNPTPAPPPFDLDKVIMAPMLWDSEEQQVAWHNTLVEDVLSPQLGVSLLPHTARQILALYALLKGGETYSEAMAAPVEQVTDVSTDCGTN